MASRVMPVGVERLPLWITWPPCQKLVLLVVIIFCEPAYIHTLPFSGRWEGHGRGLLEGLAWSTMHGKLG